MDRARIADVHKSPYDRARCVYKTPNKGECFPLNAPVDLLRGASSVDCLEVSLRGQTQQRSSVRHGSTEEGGTGTGCTYQTVPHPEEHVHLCHKHARELENQTNNLYNCINTLQRHYDDKGILYSQTLKKTNNFRDHMYFDHASFLQEHRARKSEVGKSTQSLPAVTYNTKDDKHTGLWSRTSLLKKLSSKKWPSHKNNFVDSNWEAKDTGSCLPIYVKRLLLVSCILIGLLIALAGILVGLVALPRAKSAQDSRCSEGYVRCGGEGCVAYTDVCDLPVLNKCPPFIESLCSQAKTTNSSSTTLSPEVLLERDETRVHVDIVYDERGWAHYVNSSQRESKYKVLDHVTTYSSAQQQCLRLGGHLVHITSIREQLFLEQFLRAQTQTNDESPEVARGYWLGARRARGSHSGTCMLTQWRWLDPHGRALGDVTAFSAFAAGKPDNYYKPEECLYMTTTNTFGENSFLKWDDVPCDLPGMGELLPLCEVELRKTKQ